MPTKKEAISIADILSNDTYIIPIYQRNYEWEQEQISKLIDDINSIDAGKKYYLGTLVTFKRKDGTYELVDGQQRHTTLNLIQAVLDENKKDFNLKFQARAECETFFKHISKEGFELNKLPKNEKSQNLARGVEIINEVLHEKEIDKKEFYAKFSQNTFIFRTELPSETELNHYFEIMNNRGEQLEKHEILKARLMGAFNNDSLESCVFSALWDACSNMGDYVWNNFEKSFGLRIFADPDNLSLKKIMLEYADSQKEKESVNSGDVAIYNDLSGIISNYSIPIGFTQDEQEKADVFRSVIDFPTFLLYAFYLTDTENKQKEFDDKKLLEVFNDYEKIDSEAFIIELLKTRIYFDRFIIKNDLSHQESKWGIRKYKINNGVETEESAFEDRETEDKVEMIQTMLYYSTVSENKKDWLLSVLERKPEEADLYSILFKNLSDRICDLQMEDLNYGDVTAKVFYYFEYMLWEIYFDFLRGDREDVYYPEKIASVLDKIDKASWNTYRFRQLSSKEHLLAQSKANEVQSEDVHSFGNLCLISSAQNSSANDQHPFYKKRYFKDNSSLKRLLMYKGFSGEKGDYWSTEEIKAHQAEMKSLLDFYKEK